MKNIKAKKKKKNYISCI